MSKSLMNILGGMVAGYVLVKYLLAHFWGIILCIVLFMMYFSFSGQNKLDEVMDQFDPTKVTIDSYYFSGNDIVVTIRNDSEARIYDMYATCYDPKDHKRSNDSMMGYEYVHPHQVKTLRMLDPINTFDDGCILTYQYERTDLLRRKS